MIPMGNYVSAVGNYLSVSPSELGNYVSADMCQTCPIGHQPCRYAAPLDRAELDIGWQLQRVGGQLLHRETETEASEATLPLPGICVTALRIRGKD